jgi:hypothetical protein
VIGSKLSFGASKATIQDGGRLCALKTLLTKKAIKTLIRKTNRKSHCRNLSAVIKHHCISFVPIVTV